MPIHTPIAHIAGVVRSPGMRPDGFAYLSTLEHASLKLVHGFLRLEHGSPTGSGSPITIWTNSSALVDIYSLASVNASIGAQHAR